jgi:adenosine deaminase
MPQLPLPPAADLHNHLGSSVSPSVLWSIAHRQGIKLPSKNYWEFEDMITMSDEEKNSGLEEMDRLFFHWTELIQSSPEAVELSVKAVIEGGYRKGNIVHHELRFNPMNRNRRGERDLDHIIMAAIWGMDRAMLEYPQVKAGIILMMDRRFPVEQNRVIVEKAIKYADRGVCGVDIAGPNREGFAMHDVAPLFRDARDAGLGITVHTGEEDQLEEMRWVVEDLRPDRIGHGVECRNDAALMAAVAEKGITLEVCPTSNIRNSVLAGDDEVKHAFDAFEAHGVKYAICTDGPEMYQTHVYKEREYLVTNGIITAERAELASRHAFEAGFIR